MDVLTENNNDLVRSNEVDNIPIFTEQFLDHNKHRETELRNLKKMTTDCEENNAMLQKQIEDINTTIGQLDTEIKQKKKNNAELYHHLTTLKRLLFEEFRTIQIPGTNELPTQETIEIYVQKLQTAYKPNSNSKEMDTIKQKISNVLAKCNEVSK